MKYASDYSNNIKRCFLGGTEPLYLHGILHGILSCACFLQIHRRELLAHP